VTTVDSHTLNRTTKIEIDEGRASSFEEADALTRTYRVQISLGTGIAVDLTQQAMLLTVVNAAARAFPGGVFVRADADPVMATPWARGQHLSEALRDLGAGSAGELDVGIPTIVIGDAPAPSGPLVVYPTWRGWTAGVVESPAGRFEDPPGFPLAGVLAGGLAVSEAFQFVRGNPESGRRSIGLSLWRPDLDWRDQEAIGPECVYLPANWWLLGLGHLGQAYAWAIGSLPYSEPGQVKIVLQDTDTVVPANESTGMLVLPGHSGEKKTRTLAGRLEALGLTTAIVERRFDGASRRRSEEPSLALAGFDDPNPRRSLELAGFERVIDVGLGSGPRQYLDILLHSFPSSIKAAELWPATSERRTHALLELPAYRALIESTTESGHLTPAAARCGVTELAGRTVGAAFVGVVAGTLAVAEPLRLVNGGGSFESISLSLKSTSHLQVVANPIAPRPLAGFVRASA
jgi:hypothetical protein